MLHNMLSKIAGLDVEQVLDSDEREYIENISIFRDLRILAMTLGAVLSGRGTI